MYHTQYSKVLVACVRSNMEGKLQHRIQDISHKKGPVTLCSEESYHLLVPQVIIHE